MVYDYTLCIISSLHSSSGSLLYYDLSPSTIALNSQSASHIAQMNYDSHSSQQREREHLILSQNAGVPFLTSPMRRKTRSVSHSRAHNHRLCK